MIGTNYNRWTVIGEGYRIGKRKAVKCVCTCGVVKIVDKTSVVTGASKSCGCYLSEVVREMKTTHGKEGTAIYRVWRHMLNRCNNPNDTFYKDYGGRGIKVCDRWHRFADFYEDMGDIPFVGAEIDREDNDLGYTKWNCRWVTKKVNCRNRRSSRFLQYAGRNCTIAEWSEITGLSQSLIYIRLKHGWPVDRALTQPAGPHKPKGRKGQLFAKETPIMPDCSPAWCAAEGCLCSEIFSCTGECL